MTTEREQSKVQSYQEQINVLRRETDEENKKYNAAFDKRLETEVALNRDVDMYIEQLEDLYKAESILTDGLKESESSLSKAEDSLLNKYSDYLLKVETLINQAESTKMNLTTIVKQQKDRLDELMNEYSKVLDDKIKSEETIENNSKIIKELNEKIESINYKLELAEKEFNIKLINLEKENKKLLIDNNILTEENDSLIENNKYVSENTNSKLEELAFEKKSIEEKTAYTRLLEGRLQRLYKSIYPDKVFNT